MNKRIDFDFSKKTYVMGILNITPDSFSGDGLLKSAGVPEAISEQAVRFYNDGADILDLGAESSRPGSKPLSTEKELARLIPALEKVLSLNLDVIISIDIYKAEVAKRCLELGAHMINDIWGFHKDNSLADVVAEYEVPVVLMHNRSSVKKVKKDQHLGNMYQSPEYDNIMDDICGDLQESIDIAIRAGIEKRKIILDPGIGFGKTIQQNMIILKQIKKLKDIGYPVLIGPSRKSFIGYTLDLPPEERVEGTAASIAIGIYNGADIIRVHDVKEMARIAKMVDAIVVS